MADDGNSPSDEVLFARVATGDGDALAVLVSRYQARVLGRAFNLLRNWEDAEEVFQDTFLTVYSRAGDFRGESKFSSWLFRVATNFALMRLRRRRRSPLVPEGPLGLPDGPAFSPLGRHAAPVPNWSRRPDEQLESQETLRALRRAIDGLVEPYRTAVVLRDVEGLSLKEIAAATGISVGAAKSRIHRGRLAVREALTAFLEPAVVEPEDTSETT